MRSFVQTALLAAGLVLVCAATAGAQSFTFATPSDDRWHYPFNFTPGVRATGSCFGAAAIWPFNDRDGCVVIAWDTSAQITPGLGPDAYDIQSITITLTNQPNAFWPIDLSTDEWFTYDLNGDEVINADGFPRGHPQDTDGESSDPDDGRPIELFGAGFGPVYTYENWVETSIYVGSTNLTSMPRDPFPFVFQDVTGAMLHVEDSVKGLHNEGLELPVAQFTPTPWAIGAPLAYTPAQQPIAFDVTFELDLELSDGLVRSYFQEQLDGGRLFVYVTSLREVAVMGSPTDVPSFFMKEALSLNPVPAGAKAPSLTLVLTDASPGDFDADDDVDLLDAAEFMNCFAGADVPAGSGCAAGAFDGDSDVDLADHAGFAAAMDGP